MSSETSEKRSFEERVQDRQDWIESQFRRISRGSWARIIRMAQTFCTRIQTNQYNLRNWFVRIRSNWFWITGADG